MTRHRLAAIAAAAALGLSVAAPVAPAAAQWTVFDPTNYAQNLLSATRALEQINNQIQQLQRQATMIQNQATDLARLDYSSLAQLNQSMARIDTLMRQAEGIRINIAATERALRDQFPAELGPGATPDDLSRRARENWTAAMQGYRHSLRVQAQVAENVQSDSALLAELVAQSDGAAGNLQAQQAANQLAALAARQQLQLQSLMAAQFRAEAIEQARQAQELEAARIETQRFIGSPRAYTPR